MIICDKKYIRNMADQPRTYKSKTLLESLLPTMQKLQNKHKNPINFLRTTWLDIAPKWAILAEPYMIRKNVLIMKTSSAHAITLQYREQELLQIVNTVIGTNKERVEIDRIKIITE